VGALRAVKEPNERAVFLPSWGTWTRTKTN
jgi:hypothetical protein